MARLRNSSPHWRHRFVCPTGASVPVCQSLTSLASGCAAVVATERERSCAPTADDGAREDGRDSEPGGHFGTGGISGTAPAPTRPAGGGGGPVGDPLAPQSQLRSGSAALCDDVAPAPYGDIPGGPTASGAGPGAGGTSPPPRATRPAASAS